MVVLLVCARVCRSARGGYRLQVGLGLGLTLIVMGWRVGLGFAGYIGLDASSIRI